MLGRNGAQDGQGDGVVATQAQRNHVVLQQLAVAASMRATLSSRL
jgi:hypothetical protein